MVRWLFPPGDTEWRKRRPYSAWRDFQFAFNQVQRTIEPAYPLARMLAEWNAISEALADAPRLRLAKSQRISTGPKQVNDDGIAHLRYRGTGLRRFPCRDSRLRRA